MAKIYELNIDNYQGIKKFSQKLDKDFICFVGRGDAGKTTILNAISSVLSSSWNYSFYDSDFYNGNVENAIEIEVSLIDLPESFINEDKYGLYIRGLDSDGNIKDDLDDECEKILTIKLEVKKDLEPQWHVVNSRQEPLRISANERAKFNLFMVSDYLDRHFSWSKGNPLYALLRANDSSDDEKDNIVIEALRAAKEKIDANEFEQLNEITNEIKEMSSNFGLDLSKAKTTIDFRDISIKDGRVCLHDGVVPFRLKGKGSKRLISIAIQTVLAKHGGIMLIDEVEQGLEPDRVKQLIRTIKKDNTGQVFITSHSNEVITELEADDLIIMNNNDGNVSVSFPDENFQDVIRACPEAGYAKKVIICEGKTEIGICRALDAYRKKNGKEYMSFKDCVYACGDGHSFTARAKKLKQLGLKVCTFCDSDVSTLDPSKDEIKSLDIKVFDCNSNHAIENQVFYDLPWDGIKEIVEYMVSINSEDTVKESVNSRCVETLSDNWLDSESIEKRTALGKTAKDKKWFKNIDQGETLGSVIFKYINQMTDKRLRNQLDDLSSWVEE